MILHVTTLQHYFFPAIFIFIFQKAAMLSVIMVFEYPLGLCIDRNTDVPRTHETDFSHFFKVFKNIKNF